MNNYTDANRGTIQCPQYVRIIDFSGLRYKNCTPTDVDGCLEINDTVFIMFEVKMEGNLLPWGQRTCFKNWVDLPWKGKFADHPRYGYLVKLVHGNLPLGANIIAAECKVDALYFNGMTFRDCDGNIPQELRDPVEMMNYLIENRPTSRSAFLMPF